MKMMKFSKVLQVRSISALNSNKANGIEGKWVLSWVMITATENREYMQKATGEIKKRE